MDCLSAGITECNKHNIDIHCPLFRESPTNISLFPLNFSHISIASHLSTTNPFKWQSRNIYSLNTYIVVINTSTSSNCSFGVAISKTGTLNRAYRACGKPIDQTCTDKGTRYTMDMKCYRKSIFQKTNHIPPPLKLPSDHRILLSGQGKSLSAHYT